MTKPGASATASGGDTIATWSNDSKEVQAFVEVEAGLDGHMRGTLPIYAYEIASAVHVNSANTVFWDIFNADAALLVRVLSIKHVPDIVQAVTGVAFAWLLERTTSVGTGGTAQTAWLPDLSQTALDADITCRLKPSGGAGQSTDLVNYSVHSEETNAGTLAIAAAGGLELVPEALRPAPVGNGQGILLRQNQGLRAVQITASAAGNTGFRIVFSVQ